MKKIEINNIVKSAFIGLCFLSIVSCDVDVVQEDTITSTELTEEGIIEIANNVKQVLKWQSSNSPSTNSHTFGIMFQDMRGGNAVSEANPVNWISGRDYNQFATITPSQASVQALWSKWFSGINRANTTIADLKEFEGFSNDALRTNLIAQAKFFRAFYYFELAKHYGAVPLRLESVRTLDQAVALERASSVDVVYDQIISDLTEAVPDLENNPSEKYEATQGAAYALLAKVSLYKEDYASAVQYADQVTGYSLEPNFVDNFRLSTEGNRVETILEIDFVSGGALTFEQAAESADQQGSGIYQMSGGLAGINSQWNNMIPTQEFVDSFVDGDVRKLGTLVIGGFPQEGLTADETSLATLGRPANAIQRKYYLTPSEIADLNATGNTFQTDINNLLLRYADVLLIKAEAQIMINGAGAGDTALGMVIERAGLTNSGGYDLDDIKYNRRAELAFEGLDRFTDLVRWGDAASVLGDRGFSTGRDELLPIPQLEIAQSLGVVEQNPGY